MGKNKTNRPPALMLAAALTTGLAGCKPGRAVRSGVVVDNGVKPVEQPQKPPSPVESDTGTVMGVVRWKGSAPKRTKIDMSADLVCRIAAGENQTEQYAVKDGGLANVYVYVKDGPAEAMAAAAVAQEPVLLEQSGCRFSPHVVAVMKGGAVEFRNSDGTMHSFRVGAGASAFEMTQGAKGAPEQKRFDVPAVMIPVLGKSHAWMGAFLNVSATPFFAVTDATGRFDISGLPAGTYTLAAVHEKLGEQTLSVTVASKSQSSAEFTFKAK